MWQGEDAYSYLHVLASGRASFCCVRFCKNPGAAPPTSESHDRRPPSSGRDIRLPPATTSRSCAFVALPAVSGPGISPLEAKLPLIRILATAHRLSTVSVFGSIARGKARHTSDVDLPCGTEPDATLFDIAAFEKDMEIALGYSVSVVTLGSLTSSDTNILKDAVALC
jgi:predicted nucleotidyltransferase